MVDISNNRIRALPDNLFREEGLEKLDLSSNLLSKMPLNTLAIPAAQTLCELDLSWNLISSLSHGGLLERFKAWGMGECHINTVGAAKTYTNKGLDTGKLERRGTGIGDHCSGAFQGYSAQQLTVSQAPNKYRRRATFLPRL
ncbi:hypothetical protein YQE_09513, partial [Dendroctonus ponderosae]